MPWVKTFAVHAERGVPDSYIRGFLAEAEKEGPIRVTTSVVRTPTGLLLNVIATRMDTWASMEVDPPSDVQSRIKDQVALTTVDDE